jgi:tetratricopeptide (TPR) repeat protein
MERLAIDIELVRKTGVDAPYEFQVEAEFQPQKYFLREGTGIHSELTLDWNKQLLTDLGTVQDPLADDDLRARLGERLRAFLDGKGTWKHREKQLSDIAGRLVEVNFVSGAAELYALPWELLRDQRTGLSVAMSDRVLWRYCWPERARALLKTRLSAAGNRILFAWSNDGGAVPWEVHLAALQETVKDGFLSFQGDQDMLAGVSSATIEAALASARDASRPYRVLHVLCHGRLEDNVYKLVWRDGNTLSPTEFAALVEPYAGELFLVVICACQSGGHGSPESRTGSVAQALHRAGIPVVIASRFPLSKEGSSKFCQSFYRALNGAQAGVEAAFLKARRALQVGQYGGDHLALQLWSQPLMGVAARERKLWHNLPQLRSGGFVDRRDVIEAVRDHFARQEVGNAVQPLHLSGLPGVGKTAVACEFAYQQMKDYETILWVDAQLGDITPQIAELAEHLIPDHDPSRTVEQIAQDVRLALENGGSHLIILDHVENDAIDETHLPKTGKAHVLVTSRREKLAMMETLEIKLLSTEDALLLLCGGRQLEEETLQAAEKLCEVLGRLTLPLKVAAAALTSLGPADLLEWIQDTGALRPIDELAAEHDDEAPGKGPALTLLFEKSVSLLDASDKATAVDRVARQMLYVAGYFGAAEIPLDLIANATRRAGGEEYKNHLVRRAVGRLASIGLADWSGDAVLIHRLIQAYARSRSGAAERLAVESSMAEILKDTSRLPEDLLGLGKLRVHMEAVCETMRADTPLQHLWIPVRLAQHLVMAMSYRRALDVTERWIRMLGENATPWHAQLLNIRGEALYEMGRINEAVDCLRKVESVMAGLEDIDPAIRVQNQAILFKALIDKGDFKEGFGIAQALYNDLGDDPLAEVGKIMTPERLFDFSRLREVIPQMEQALARSCEAMGQDHPAVVSLLKATARINVTAGRFERARVLSRRAAEYAERVYGREHVNVAEALEIFGGTSIDSGHVDEAIEALQRARGILESVPQANPVHRTAVLALLARAHLRKGSMTEAQDLATKAA